MKKTSVKAGVFCVLFFLTIAVWQQVFALAGPHYLKVDVLDVGQGDAIFIQTPAMRQILIDGGPGQAVLSQVARQLPFWQRSLDMVILTHPDADHLDGLIQVLKKYQVDYVLWTGIKRDGQGYQEWLRVLARAKEKGTKIIIAQKGTTIASAGVAMSTLNPQENLEGQAFGKVDNDTGIVQHLIYGKKSFLFTADTSSQVEQQLIDSGADLASDVLKVGHHGSKYSTSENFLQAVHPSIAAISVGANNTYGHPTPEVLQRLQNFGITTIRTDQKGTIEILSDGNNINIY